jgi:hypothetical protein
MNTRSPGTKAVPGPGQGQRGKLRERLGTGGLLSASPSLWTATGDSMWCSDGPTIMGANQVRGSRSALQKLGALSSANRPRLRGLVSAAIEYSRLSRSALCQVYVWRLLSTVGSLLKGWIWHSASLKGGHPITTARARPRARLVTAGSGMPRHTAGSCGACSSMACPKSASPS